MTEDPYRYFRIESRELADELAAGVSDLARGVPTATAVAAMLRHAHTLKGAARVVSRPEIADRAHALEELLEPHRGSALPIPDDARAGLLSLIDEISAEVAALEEPSDGTSPGTTGGSDRFTLTFGTSPTGPAAPVTRALPVRPATSVKPITLPPIPPAAGARRPVTVAVTPPSPFTPPTPSEPPTPVPEAGSPAQAHARERERTARASLAEIDAVIAGVRATRTQFAGLHHVVTRLTTFQNQLAEPVGTRPGDRQRKVSGLQAAAEEVQRTLTVAVDRMDRELRGVRDVVERLRLVAVDTIVPDLDRAARDVAAEQGKRVRLDVTGAELRLDAPVLTAAHAALRQIVRNAVAHGIELPEHRTELGKDPAGLITLRVSQSNGLVVFTCHDDGRGVDLAAVRTRLEAAGHTGADRLPDEEVLELLLLGGVSTAAAVSEVSGRGIGLDVVHDAAVQLGGRARIRTEPGRGTTIELAVSVSLAAQDVILVDGRLDGAAAGWSAGTADERADDAQVLALPLRAVSETVRLRADQIRRAPRGESIFHRGRSVPFAPLAAAMGKPASSSRAQATWSVLILESAAGPAAIGVRRLVGTAGIAIRPVPELAPVPPVVGGVWVDVDGRPQLVLNPDELVAAVGARRELAEVGAAAATAPILVIDDSLTTRMLEQSILESAGYQVQTAASAEEGLELALQHPFALVLVDVEMPGMDGFGFVAQTRARPELAHLPCILVTSRASEEDRRRGAEAGARAHIDKREFHQGTLLRLIAEEISGTAVNRA